MRFGHWMVRGSFAYLVSTLLPEHWYRCTDHTASVVLTLGAHKTADTRLFLREHRIELSVPTFVSHRRSGCLPQFEEIGRLEPRGDCRNDGCHARRSCKT